MKVDKVVKPAQYHLDIVLKLGRGRVIDLLQKIWDDETINTDDAYMCASIIGYLTELDTEELETIVKHHKKRRLFLWNRKKRQPGDVENIPEYFTKRDVERMINQREPGAMLMITLMTHKIAKKIKKSLEEEGVENHDYHLQMFV